MSTFISLKSACGRSSASVDIFDIELNETTPVKAIEYKYVSGRDSGWKNLIYEYKKVYSFNIKKLQPQQPKISIYGFN